MNAGINKVLSTNSSTVIEYNKKTGAEVSRLTTTTVIEDGAVIEYGRKEPVKKFSLSEIFSLN